MPDEITKLFTTAFKSGEDSEVAIASSGALDRDGEIIDPKGWELDNYLAAGQPIQADHNSSIFATIGNGMWTKVSGGKLKFKPRFHEATQAGKDAKALWDAGIVKTFSVGFLPKEWVDGGPDDKFRRKFTRQELLEISMTPVPSNPEAKREIAKAFQSGVIKDHDFAEYIAPGSTLDATEELDDAVVAVVDNEPKEEPKEEPKDESITLDETIEIDESIEIPEDTGIEIDDKMLSESIEKKSARIAEIVIATRKGRVIEI